MRNRPDAVEARDASAAEEVEEESLDGVVAVVCRGDHRLLDCLVA